MRALLAYLETDAELNDRVGELRQTAALLGEALGAGPALGLDADRKAALLAEAATPSRRLRFVDFARQHLRPAQLASAAAVVAMAVLSGLLFMPRDEGPLGDRTMVDADGDSVIGFVFLQPFAVR